MVYDPSDSCIDESAFELKDWTSSEFGHLQGKEELPPNMPEPRGQGFVMGPAYIHGDNQSILASCGPCVECSDVNPF